MTSDPNCPVPPFPASSSRPATVRLGSLALTSRYTLAPLAGYTNLPFRLTVREVGGLGLATTDLINARAILERRPRSFELAETTEEDRPLSIQIYGTIIDEMCRAARWVVENGATIVDGDVSEHPEALPKHPGIRRRSGFLGFQSHSEPVQFLKIAIREIR